MNKFNPSTPKLSARHLGRLLLMQSVLEGLPDEKSIRGFVSRGLSEMPGVAEARIQDAPGILPGRDIFCFPLRVGEVSKGEVLVICSDVSAFRPYVDTIKNFCFVVAVILEERQLRRTLESDRKALEQQVQERTRQLLDQVADLSRREERERALLVDAEKGRAALLGILEDQKLAEEALQRAEREMELFFSQSLDGFFFMMLDEPMRWDDTVDKEQAIEYMLEHQRITKVNQAMLEQYRASREQFIGKTPADLFSHDLKQVRPIWRQFYDLGRLHVETDERRFDGTHMWVEGDYICLYDSEGRITGHFGVQRDVTARRQAGVEITNARNIAESLSRHLVTVREEERARISREIHDELGSALTALKIDASTLLEQTNLSEESRTKLGTMVRLITSTSAEVQRIAADLRPAILDDLGLTSTIEWYCGEFEKRSKIECTAEVEMVDPVDPTIRLTLFRLLQESLTNVARHAKASKVFVRLGRTSNAINLEVEDNGIGMDRNSLQAATSVGVHGMRERVREIQGTISIGDATERGTKIVFTVPSVG